MPTNVVRPYSRSSALSDDLVGSECESAASSSLEIPLPTILKPASYLLYIVFIVTLGPLQFGFHLGELNAPQRVITCQADSPLSGSLDLTQCIPMSPSQWGLVQSIFTVGGFVGALIGGPVTTKYGRLLAMQATTLVFIVGPLASALANSLELMILGRFLSGIGAGASTVVCPMYVAEVSPPDKRGLFGAFTQVMINIGVLIAQLLGYFLSNNNLWRVILAAAALIGTLELIGLHSIPESPKWLADNAFTAVARQVSQSIGVDLETETNMAGKVFGDYEQELLLGVPASTWTAPPQGPSVSLLEALREPIYRRAVVAVIAAMFAQQATGINCVVMYSVEILDAALPSDAVLITVIVSIVNVLVTIMCAPLADKIGRKPCLLVSIGGIGTGSLLLAMGLIHKVSGLSVFATFLFVASFGVGLGPVPFILASELVDSEAYGAVQIWGLTACWLANFSVAQFFPMLDAALPNGYVFWVFVVIAVAIGSFIAWWVPESKGKATTAEVWGDK